MVLKFLKKNGVLLVGAILGLASGYGYWHQVGCVTGTCAITSSPVNATLYGGLMGVLVFSFFKDLWVKSKSQ